MRENPTQKPPQNPAEKAAEMTLKTPTRLCAICARVATARDWHKHIPQISVPIIIGTLPNFADIIGTRKTLAKRAFRAFLCQCAKDFSHLHTIGKKIHKKIYIGGETRARARGTSRFDGRNPAAKTERKICAKNAAKFYTGTAAETTAPNRTANAAEIAAEPSTPRRAAFAAFAELSTPPQRVDAHTANPAEPGRARRATRRGLQARARRDGSRPTPRGETRPRANGERVVRFRKGQPGAQGTVSRPAPTPKGRDTPAILSTHPSF